jgi:hypothetical protein
MARRALGWWREHVDGEQVPDDDVRAAGSSGRTVVAVRSTSKEPRVST